MATTATTNSIAEDLEEIRNHPMYKLFDGYVIDFDLRNYNVKTYQRSSEQAKAQLLKDLLSRLEDAR